MLKSLEGKRSYIAAAVIVLAGVVNATLTLLVSLGYMTEDTARAITEWLNALYVIFVGGGIAALRSAIANSAGSSEPDAKGGEEK